MKLLSDIGQVISELEGWEKKYLPDSSQVGKIELLDIVNDTPLKSVVSWLEWNHHRPEANKIKAECTKILRWLQTTDGVFSQKDLDDNPFVADEKRFSLKLTDMLQGILGNLKADLAPEKPTETGQNDVSNKVVAYEIDLMEELADMLKNWHGAKVRKDTDFQLVPTISDNRLCLELYLSTKFERVMEWLLCNKPDLAKNVKKAYEKLLDEAEGADEENRKNQLYDFNLMWAKVDAYQLAEKFSHIAKMVREELAQQKPAKSERKTKADQVPKKKKRSSAADMVIRNKAVAMAAAQLRAQYDRLPIVDEIIAETKLTRQQVYCSAPYQEGKIAKQSAKRTKELMGGSVMDSEQFGRKSIEHSRADRRSKSEQAELDTLIDEQSQDDKSNCVL